MLVAVQLLQDREHRRQQALQVVEKEFTVDRHAAILYTRGRRRVLRVADVCRESILPFLEFGPLSHWQPPPVLPAAAFF